VLAVLVEGIDAIEGVAGRYTDAQWAGPTPCDEWDAAQLAGHVVCVSGWYHAWLDRAEAGDATAPFSGDLLPEQNRRALEQLQASWTGSAAVDGPASIADYTTSARAYADRLGPVWDLPYGYPRGTVTAGLHAGTAAVEWHVHAWDLARSIGADHRPSDPETLLRAAATTQAAAQVGRGRGLAGGVARSVSARRARRDGDPWRFLLGVAGRVPDDDGGNDEATTPSM
jgi:uncharacterized protein (TIGR03083 family)